MKIRWGGARRGGGEWNEAFALRKKEKKKRNIAQIGPLFIEVELVSEEEREKAMSTPGQT